jgi:hypothetical protein
MPYIILRGRWFHIIVLNVHAQTEDKIDDTKDSFYEELERVINIFHKYRMETLLGDLSAMEAGKTYLNQQLGMKVYTKLVMVMELEYYIFSRLKVSMSKAQ